MNPYRKSNLTGLDYAIMLLLVVIISTVIFLNLNIGHNWGDDFAAYVAEGIAFSKGTFLEQTQRNGEIVGSSEPMVYVWSLPLLLSGVHKLVGFDVNGFESIIYYKIPGSISLVVLSVVLYLFFRKRFGRGTGFAVSLLFSANPAIIALTNEILTDMLFTCMAWIAMHIMYNYLYDDSRSMRYSRAANSFLLGIVIYLANITRYIGFALLIVLGVVQLMQIISLKIRPQREQISIARNEVHFEKICLALLPYITFLFLYFFIGLFMPYARTQASDIQSTSLANIFLNLHHYYFALRQLVFSIIPSGIGSNILSLLIVLITCVGVASSATKELPAFFYMTGTLGFVIFLPYFQGLRYILNVVPCMLLFFIYGMVFFGQRVMRKDAKQPSKNNRIIKYSLLTLACIMVLFRSSVLAYKNIISDRIVNDGAYSISAIDMYAHIRASLELDDSIAFTKARALSLNTERLSYYLHSETAEIPEKADYLLLSIEPAAMLQFNVYDTVQRSGKEIIEVYSNESLMLYRIISK